MNLLSRLFIFNFAGAAIVAWAWMIGLVDLVTAADTKYHVTYVIAAAFLAGLAFTFWRGWCVVSLRPRNLLLGSELPFARSLARRAGINNMAVGDVVESLAMLALLGSALGMLLAFVGIDKAALTSLDGIKDAAANVLTGVSTLAGATFAGMALALWTIWNNRMLETATALYLEDLS